MLRAIGLVAATAHLVAAATFVDIASDPTDPVGNGAHVRLGSADGAFTWYAELYYADALRVGSVSVNVALGTPDDPHSWFVRVSAPNTGYLSAGDTYDFSFDPFTGYPPNFDGASAVVSHDGTYLSTATCARLHDRFVVHELSVWETTYTLRSLVAEVEARCDERDAAIRAAIRYHSGDPACDGPPDGTACSDADGCTGADRCEAERCVSGAPPTARAGGERLARTRHRDGVRTRRQFSRRARIAGLYVLRADGTYAVPSFEPPCTSIPEPDEETGAWREGRHRRLVLRLGSRQELANVIRVCSELQRARVVGSRQWVRVAHGSRPPCPWAADAGGAPSMCGGSTTRFAVVFRGVPLTLVYRTRFAGARVDDGAYLPPAR